MRKVHLILMATLILTYFMFLGCATSSFESRVHNGYLSPWYSAKSMMLNVDWEEAKLINTFDMRTFENGDTYILSDRIFTAKDNSSAEAMVIGGRVLLTKNIQIQENHAIDVFDTTALFQQLALTLIDLASESGPERTAFPVHRTITESKYPIKVRTQSAGGSYNAPWEATIDLTKKNNGVINYNIAFSFTTLKKDKSSMKLSGTLSNYGRVNGNAVLPDNFNISGWQQYDIGVYTKETDKGTIHDFGTTYLAQSFSTLGELRKYIKEKYKK